MHTLAKIMLSGIGIFFAIRLIASIVTAIALALTYRAELPIFTALLWTGVFALCVAVVCYIFIYKREQLAKRIVGTDELPEPDSPVKWLPVAFRLISIAAGLYCLHTVLWQVTNALIRYAMYKARSIAGYRIIYTGRSLNIEGLLVWLIMLTIGIYLACGAPHFVRWHVRRTLEQCKQQPETNA
jgi:hypothetical protein